MSDNKKMFLSATLIVLSLLAFAGIFGFAEVSRNEAEQNSKNAMTIQDLAAESYTEMLEARRREKDFQLRSDEKYIGRVKSHVATMREKADGLKGKELTSEDTELVNRLFVAIDKYEAAFDRMVKSAIELGLNEKLGLQGQLRTSVKKIENRLKDVDEKAIEISMLTLRRREKDFLLRGKEKYIKALNQEAENFSDRLNASFDLEEAVKENLEAELKVYVASFNNYSRVALNLQKEKKAVSAAAAEVGAVLTPLRAGAKKTRMAIEVEGTERTSLIRWLYGISLGLGSIFIIAVVLFLNRSIKKSIGAVVESLLESSIALNEASKQVAAASQGLAEGSSQQAASLEETSSTLEEIAGMTRQNADNAKQADLLAGKNRTRSEEGREAMLRLVTAISEIKESSNKTAKIIKTIDEIAFQTNLLALNAAVEAARAGDAGKGFAVVAEEVRNLAQRAASAAKDTTSLIDESQEKADTGSKVANEVEQLLQEIVSGADGVGGLLNEMAAASEEQARGVDQISQAMGQMDNVTQANAANAEETASASQYLTSQASTIEQIGRQLAGLSGGGSTSRQVNKISGDGDVPQREPTEPGSLREMITEDAGLHD